MGPPSGQEAHQRPVCAGNADDPEQFGLLAPEVPAPPPSYPLILDRDPVPEEMVR